MDEITLTLTRDQALAFVSLLVKLGRRMALDAVIEEREIDPRCSTVYAISLKLNAALVQTPTAPAP